MNAVDNKAVNIKKGILDRLLVILEITRQRSPVSPLFDPIHAFGTLDFQTERHCVYQIGLREDQKGLLHLDLS